MPLVRSAEVVWVATRADLELDDGLAPYPPVVWVRFAHTREEFIRVGLVYDPWPHIGYAVYVGPGNVLMKVLP